MARTDETWEEVRGTFLQTLWRAGRDILINGYNHYLNFGLDNGDEGYGFRDHDGVMQFKNDAGTWTDIGAGSGTGVVVEIVAGPYVAVNNTDPARPIVSVDGVEPALGNPATDDEVLYSKIDGTRYFGPLPTVSGPVWQKETPTGLIDGENVTYTLSDTPVAGSLFLFLNSRYLTEDIDYTLLGDTITMTDPLPVEYSGLPFHARYQKV